MRKVPDTKDRTAFISGRPSYRAHLDLGAVVFVVGVDAAEYLGRRFRGDCPHIDLVDQLLVVVVPETGTEYRITYHR